AHSSIMSATNTIKFNVGGKHFEVSRDLMEMHSETMLGKLVSEAWQQDPEESVFIDRDGDIFAHILNYLRYGSIELPHTIPKSSFERDLDFYGLGSKEGDIKEKSILAILDSLEDAKMKHDMILFAIEVHHQYAFRSYKNFGITVYEKDLREKLGHSETFFSCEEKKLFVNYLDVYFGLEAQCYINGSFQVTRK
ncbi:hypothetical protein ACHAWT_008598, partial [Skeletonema menzelii]